MIWICSSSVCKRTLDHRCILELCTSVNFSLPGSAAVALVPATERTHRLLFPSSYTHHLFTPHSFIYPPHSHAVYFYPPYPSPPGTNRRCHRKLQLPVGNLPFFFPGAGSGPKRFSSPLSLYCFFRARCKHAASAVTAAAAAPGAAICLEQTIRCWRDGSVFAGLSQADSSLVGDVGMSLPSRAGRTYIVISWVYSYSLSSPLSVNFTACIISSRSVHTETVVQEL